MFWVLVKLYLAGIVLIPGILAGLAGAFPVDANPNAFADWLLPRGAVDEVYRCMLDTFVQALFVSVFWPWVAVAFGTRACARIIKRR